MKLKRYAVICYVLLIALLLSFSSMAVYPYKAQFEAPDYVTPYSNDPSDSQLSLSFDYKEGVSLNIMVTDARTGKVWETNPIFTSGDRTDNTERRKLLGSQICIKYSYDPNGNAANLESAGYMTTSSKEQSLDSYTDSIIKDQVEIIEITDASGKLVTLRVEYGFGNVKAAPYPKFLTYERFMYWLDQCVTYDEDGNVIYQTDEAGNPIYETDEEGNQVFDEDGNPKLLPVYNEKLRKELENKYEEISIEDIQKDNERILNKIKDDKEREEKKKKLDEEFEKMLDEYPILLEQDGTQKVYKIYASEINSAYKKTQMEKLWANLGYTRQNLEEDYLEAGYVDSDGTLSFVIPVEYRIVGNEFHVEVMIDEIDYPSEVGLLELSLLPGFAAGDDTTTEAYSFVPDGSGAVIFHNKADTRVTGYVMPLLDRTKDEAISSVSIKDLPYYESNIMPVFGQKQDDNAFFAIIQKGYEMAGIYASIADGYSKYNLSYPVFYPTVTDDIYYSSGSTSGIRMFPKMQVESIGEYKDDVTKMMVEKIVNSKYCRLPDTNLEVSYVFLSGDNANYVGMANYYRDYMIKTYSMEKLTAEDNIPLYADLFGVIDKKVAFVGFPVNVKYALTTFEQATEIVEAIKATGIDNINVRYLYMANGGAVTTMSDKFNVMSKLGGAKGFKNFLSEMNSMGVNVYPDVDILHIYADKLFDGFTPKNQAAMTLGKTQTIVYDKNLATGRNENNSTNYSHFHPRWVLSTKKYAETLAEMFKDYEEFDNKKISLSTLGSTINSDYNEKLIIDRTQTARVVSSLLSQYKNEGYDILVEKGFIHTLPYVTGVIGLPLSSSQLIIEDYEVPFLQMIVHGMVEYVGESINTDQDYKSMVLKCLEYGAGVYGQFMYEDNKVFQNTNYQNFYSLNYTAWLDTLEEVYSEVNAVLKDVQDQLIVNHERLAPGVFRTTYEGGKQIIVNYNIEDYSDGAGLTVAAQGYAVTGGAR